MAWLNSIFSKKPTHLPDHLQSCWKRLESLKRKDRGLKVFGASHHKYQSKSVSEADLAAFESWCGVALPGAYRDHLKHIGHGLGPYYGLWSLTKIRAELQDILADWEIESGPKPSISRPFPYSSADAEMIETGKANGDETSWITSTWPVDGCIPIGHQGCTYYSVLVLTGECAGRLWNVANQVGSEGQWLPSWRPTACLMKKRELNPLPALPSPPTFEQWFTGWVERAESDLASSE